MKIAESKLTSQGQVSVPAEVRRRLGLAPGSVIEWDEEDGRVVVRRAGTLSFDEIHRRLFPDGPPRRRSIEEMDAGIGRAAKERLRRASR